MLYLIVGKNSYVAEQELAKVTQHASVPVEHIDTQQLDAAGLAELVRGVSLFAAQRLIVLRRLSERPDLWEQLGQWAHNIPSETTLVLVEPGLDKRTKTYKALHKAATIIAADPLTDRQRSAAERWLRQLASARGVSLSPAHVRSMVERALIPDEKGYGGSIDQLQLAHAIDTWRAGGTGDATRRVPRRQFESADDLLLVPGMDYATYARIRPLVTADTYQHTNVNPLAAPLPVLLVLARGNAAVAQRIASRRDAGEAGVDTTGLDPALTGAGFSQFFRVTARVPLDAGRIFSLAHDVALSAYSSSIAPWRTLRTQGQVLPAGS